MNRNEAIDLFVPHTSTPTKVKPPEDMLELGVPHLATAMQVLELLQASSIERHHRDRETQNSRDMELQRQTWILLETETMSMYEEKFIILDIDY